MWGKLKRENVIKYSKYHSIVFNMCNERTNEQLTGTIQWMLLRKKCNTFTEKNIWYQFFHCSSVKESLFTISDDNYEKNGDNKSQKYTLNILYYLLDIYSTINAINYVFSVNFLILHLKPRTCNQLILCRIIINHR